MKTLDLFLRYILLFLILFYFISFDIREYSIIMFLFVIDVFKIGLNIESEKLSVHDSLVRPMVELMML